IHEDVGERWRGLHGFRRLRVRQAKTRPKERPLTVIDGTDKTCPVGITRSVGRRLLRPDAKRQRSGIHENKDKRCLFHHVPPFEFEGPSLPERRTNEYLRCLTPPPTCPDTLAVGLRPPHADLR